MIQSYKKKIDVQEQYDTIVIGSGMGGLTTAAILAKQGQKVLVLERHYEPGGFTHTFKRRGYEWDVGIHYIGEVQRNNSIIKKLFDYITNSKLKWADMGEVYDKIIIGTKEYDFVKGVQNFKNKVISYFPKEEKAITAYIHLVFDANRVSKNFYLEKALPFVISKIVGGMMRKPYLKYADRTTYDVLRSLTENQELIKVLTGQYGDYGLSPKKSSFVMHAAVARHYFSGGSFPIGGSSQIVQTVDPIIEASGGTVLISAEVDEIIVHKNKARGVKMKDGKRFFAKNIVSGAGIMTTYHKLLSKSTGIWPKLESQLQHVERSVAHACLYVGLEGSPSTLELPKTNYWIYPDDLDHDGCVDRYLNDLDAEFPVVYISFPSAKDPDWSKRYPDKSTIDIITLVPYEAFESWSDTNWKKRGKDYDTLKEKISKRLLDVLYKHIPQVHGKVAYYELSTPLTTRHFVNYEKGEIYGLDHTPKRFRQAFLKPRTPIKRLYLTGQDIMTAGVGSALFSGVLTTTALTRKNILKQITKTE